MTPLAIIMAIASTGAGHGDYASARVLFPVPMLLTRATGDTIGVPSTALALMQFPIYGAVSGWCAGLSRRATLFAVTGILLLHLLGIIACFCGALPNFS